MKTIKCKITNDIDVSEYIRKYNSILHIAFNAFKDGLTQPEIKKIINLKFKGLNSFIIQNAIIQAQGIYKLYETRKEDYEAVNPNKKFKSLIFGGRNNLKQYLTGKISKEEFKKHRQKQIVISGETRHKGNRLFNFDFENNSVVFKPNKGIKIPIEFKMSQKQKRELMLIQTLCFKDEFSLAISFNEEYVCFHFDEEKLYNESLYYTHLKNERILGIDQNPNYLGISILEFDKNNEFKVIHKQIFDISKLTVKSGKSSLDKKSKYIVNKRKFETINLAYEIDKLVNVWKVKKVSIEDLSFKSSFESSNLNRLCKNSWDRLLFENKLKMLSNAHGYDIIEVNPCYTSQIGNIIYGNETTPDMVAASIEIARRGFKKFEKGWFYPKFDKSLSQMNEQWKQTLFDNQIKDWKELFSLIKNSKLKYRVFLDQIPKQNLRKFSLNNKNSFVTSIIYLNENY